MKVQRLALLLATAGMCATITGCSSTKSEAEEAVRRGLKDPDSAKFGEFYENTKTKKACLTVNARNEMGGYTGRKQVRLRHTDDGWEWGTDAEQEESAADCKEYFADAAD